MNLTEKRVTKYSSDYREIVALMKNSFPKDELVPIWLLRAMALKKNYKFSAFYDDNIFAGILFTIEKDDTLFVLYIAINDKIQSKGYGSKLLQTLIQKYNNKLISLCIETLDTKANNYEQRVKRLAFYKKNGFFNTNIKIGNKNIPSFDILSTDRNFSIEQCKKIVKFTSLKIFPTTVK